VKLHSHKSSKTVSSPGKENNAKLEGKRKRVKREHSAKVEWSNVSALDDSKMEIKSE